MPGAKNRKVIIAKNTIITFRIIAFFVSFHHSSQGVFGGDLRQKQTNAVF
jgi:hypothetical protein